MARSEFATHWLLDPEVVFLNHGSFGATPMEVLDYQSELRDRMEREPVTFLVDDLESLLDRAKTRVGAFLGCDPADLAFVSNATTGFNAVVRSLTFKPGDELLVTTHGYNAARNAMEYAASRFGARVVAADIPFPIHSPGEVTAAVLKQVTSRTRLALIDHVTSPTALIFPIREIVRELESRGIDTLVDGAHAPGMFPLSIDEVGAAYYTGNCHKWISAPKGAAILHVRKDRQDRVRPVSISHGANSPRTDRSRFRIEFDWTGTIDATPWLAIPAAIDFFDKLVPGGWSEVMKRNRALALQGRRILCEALETAEPAPEEMIGSMGTVILPPGPADLVVSPVDSDPLHYELMKKFGIEVPVWPYPQPPGRVLRISAHLYNDESEYRHLASALKELIGS